jgi:glycosyltransferase involved in cell wall biosynthesis
VDIVHVIGTRWELLGIAAWAIARRREAAFTISPTLHPGTWGDSVLDAALYKAADGVIALTSAEAAHLHRLGVPSEGIAVSGLGPSSPIGGDGQRFRRTHAVGDRPMILFVGRRQRYKGYHALCGAMAETAERFPDALLVVVGAETEPLFPTVPPKRFLDLGECSDETKADALAACDVFCMPSEDESFGMAYVEAWAYGKPVVAGPAPAAREIVAASGGGVCVENEPASIADGLKRLLGDPALRQRLGTEGHRYQQCEFQWDVVATRHLDAFRRALSARRRPQLAGHFLPVNTPFASSSAGGVGPSRR